MDGQQPPLTLQTAVAQSTVIRQCIADKMGRLSFQPIVRLDDRQVMLNEVLVRIIDYACNEYSPGSFLQELRADPMLSISLDCLVLDLLRQQVFSIGLPHPRQKLSINISSASLQWPQYVDALLGNELRPVSSRLVFELQAFDVLQTRSAVPVLQRLARQGSALAVDYFGGGTDMLKTSSKMGFNYIKFAADKFNADDQADIIRLRQLAATTQQLGMTAILEKVASKADFDLAVTAEVPLVQGFYVMPTANVPA